MRHLGIDLTEPVDGRASQKDTQIGEDTETEIAKNAAEIAHESARIQKEMEQERRSKSPPVKSKSPPRSPSRYEGNRSPSRFERNQTPPRKLPVKAFRIKPADDTEDNEPAEDPNLSGGWNERRVITQETLRLQTQLRSTEADLREMEQILKENRAKAEDARTQLMLTEFRRSNSIKELEKLSDELNQKRMQMKALEIEAAAKREELLLLGELGLTKEEVVTMVEDNTTLNQRIKNHDALQLERDELLRQLEATKTDLFSEQKMSRKKLEEYQEEVESLSPKLEEAQTECEQLAQKLHQLQNESRGVEKDRDDTIQERDKLIEEFRETIKRDHLEARKHYSKDTEELRQKIHALNCQVITLETDNSEQEDIVMALRDEIIDLQQQVGREQSLRDTMKEEHNVILNHVKQEHENAMSSLRGSMMSEKEAEMDKLEAELHQEKTEDASKLQEQLNEQLTDQSRQISMKSQEISRLQDQIQVFEESRLQMEDRVRVETQKQVREAVEKERQIQQTEHDWMLQREKEMAVSDLKKQLTDLNIQMAHERKTKESAQNHMIHLQKEIDGHHNQTKEAGKSKVIAVARAKELAREQGHTELQRLKEKFKQEYKKEIDRLRQLNRNQEEEVKLLKSDIETKARRDRENGLVLDRTERTIVNELNEECRRTANLLDVTPRKVNVNSFKQDNSGSGSAGGRGPGRTPTTAALANLRACNEQLRNHLGEVVQERDGLRNSSERLLQEKTDSLESMQIRMDREKNADLENLKQRLLKDHFAELEKIGSHSNSGVDENWMAALKQKDKELRDIQKSLNSWKEDTAEKFAKKFEDELNKELEKQQKKQKDVVRINDSQQKQIERLEREVHKLTMNQKISPNSADSLAMSKMVHNLQMKMKQLQSENNTLRRSKYSASVPDLTVGSLYLQKDLNPVVEKDDFNYLSYRYQTKPERDVDTFIERPQSPISKRLTEMNKLQTTLSNQTKELKQLERAYSQLHAPRSPSRNSLHV